MDKLGPAVVSLVAFALFVSLVPVADAVAADKISLSADKSSGRTSEEYAFTAEWGSAITSQKGFAYTKDVKLEFKSASGSWTTFSSAPALPMQVVVGGTTKTKIVPSSVISKSGTYSFRLNYKSGTVLSNEVKINFNNECSRKSPTVKPMLSPGDWYSVGSDGTTAEVALKVGKELGGGKILEYTMTVQNVDSGCGASKFRLEVEGTGVDRDPVSSGHFGPYIYTVTKPGTSGETNIASGGTADFAVRIQANDKIGGVDQAEGRVNDGGRITLKVTNVDSGQYYTKNVEIKVKPFEECNYDTPPQIVIEPQSQVGYAGEKLAYKMRIQNRNTGGEEECAVSNFEISRVGVQYFQDVQRGDLGEFKFADEYSWRWAVFIGDKLYSATSQSNVFDGNKGGTVGNFIEFIAKAGPPYTAQIAAGKEKEVAMEVSSYDPSLCSTCTQQPGYGQRSIAVCVRTAKQSEVCGKAFYDFRSNLDTSVGERILIDIGSTYKIGSTLDIRGHVKDGPTPVAKAAVRMDVYKPDGSLYYGRGDSTNSDGMFQNGIKIEEGSPSGTWKVEVKYTGKGGKEVKQSAAFTVPSKDDTTKPEVSTRITDVTVPTNAGPNVDSVFTWKLNDLDTFTHTNVHCYPQIIVALKGSVDRLSVNDWAMPSGEMVVAQIASTKITSKTSDNKYTGVVKFPYADEKTGFYCRVHVETTGGEHLLSEVQKVKVYASGESGADTGSGSKQKIIVVKEPESQVTIGKSVEFKWRTEGIGSFGSGGHTNLHCYYSSIPAWRTQAQDVVTKRIAEPTASGEYSDVLIPREAKNYYCRIHADDGVSGGDKSVLSEDIWHFDCGTSVCTVTKIASSADVGGVATGGGSDNTPASSGQKVTMTSAPSGTIDVDQAVEFKWRTEGVSSIAAGHTNLHCYTRSAPAWRTDSIDLKTTNDRMTTTSSSGEYSDTVKFPANKKFWCRAHADSGTTDSPLSEDVYVVDCGAATCSVASEKSAADAGGKVTSTDTIEITMLTTPTTGKTGEGVTFQWRLSGLGAFGHSNAHTNVHCLKQAVSEKKAVDQVSLLEWAIPPADLQGYVVSSEKVQTKGDSYSGSFKPDASGKYYCKVHATADDYNHFLTTSTFTVDVTGATVTNPPADTGGVSGDYIKDVKYPSDAKVGAKGAFAWKVSGLDTFVHTNVHCAKPSAQDVDKRTEADWGTITGDKALNGPGISKSSSGEYSQELTFADEGTYKCRIHVDAGSGKTYLLNPVISSEPYKVAVTKDVADPSGGSVLTCGDADGPNDINNAETVSAGKKCNQIDTSDKDYYRLEIDKTKKYTVKTTGCGQTGGAETKAKVSLKTNSDVYVSLAEGKKGTGSDCSVIEFGPLPDESNLVRFIEVTGTRSGVYNLEITAV